MYIVDFNNNIQYNIEYFYIYFIVIVCPLNAPDAMCKLTPYACSVMKQIISSDGCCDVLIMSLVL